MTVETTTYRNDYNGDDSTTEFAYEFKVPTNAEIKVILEDATGAVTTLTLDTDYTVAGAGDDVGGSVTLATPPATGEKLHLLRNMAFTQGQELTTAGPWPAKTVESAFDRAAMRDQQILEAQRRNLSLPESMTGVDPTLPTPIPNTVIGWDAEGASLENKAAPGELTVGNFGVTLVAADNAATARAALDSPSASEMAAAIAAIPIPPIDIEMWPISVSPVAYVTDAGSVNPERVIALPDGSTSQVLGRATLPQAGRAYQLKASFFMSAAQASKAVSLALKARSVSAGDAGSDPGAWDFDSGTAFVSTRDDTGMNVVVNASFVIPDSMPDGDNQLVGLSFQRLGADAGDTHTGTLYLTRLELEAL